MIIKTFLKALTGFIVLDLYFVFITTLLNNPVLQFAGLLLFFPLAFFIAKWVGLNGLKGLGLKFHPGWVRNFLLSLLVGFCFWMIWYGLDFWGGQMKFIGVRRPAELPMPIIEVFIGYFMGSLINDLIIRGYIMNLLIGKIHIAWVFTISIAIYALDDYWYAGFSLSNIIFSIILGLSLTFAFYKTGSIWADTGLHYGLNIAYGLFYGLVGKAGNGIFIIQESGQESLLSLLLPYLIPAIMFIFVWWINKFYSKNNNSTNPAAFST